MAERNNPRSSGGLAQKTKPRDTSFDRLRGIQRPTTAPLGRRDRTRPAGRNAQAGSPQPLPDTRQSSFSRTLEHPRLTTPLSAASESAINQVRRSENTPTQSPLNYTGGKTVKDGSTGSPVGGNSKQGTGKQSPLNRLGGWFGRHKKASVAALSGGLVGGTMMIFGGTMSGPAQIVHAGEFLGGIINTIHDIVSAERMARNASRSLSQAFSVARQNSRVSTASRILARGYEKTLKRAGFELISDEAGRLTHIEMEKGLMKVDDLQKGGMVIDDTSDAAKAAAKKGKVLVKFADGAKAADKSKAFRSTMKIISQTSNGIRPSLITKSTILTSLATRILGKMNLTVGFHPIRRLSANIMMTKAGKIMTRVKHIDKTLSNFVVNKAKALAKRATGKAAGETASKVGSKVSKGVLKVITTGLKATVIGSVIGFALDFVVSLTIKRLTAVSLKENLNAAEGKAMEIVAEASQTKSNSFPTETAPPNKEIGVTKSCDQAADDEECYEAGTPLDELGNFIKTNFHQEVNVVDSGTLVDCDLPEEPSDEEIEDCLNKANGEFTNLVNNSGGSGPVAVSSFWRSAGVKYETGETYDKKDGTVPVELMTDKDSPGEWLKDIANSAIETVAFVSPDMFEGDGHLDTESASPAQIGSIATFGSKTASNAKMLSAGGTSYPEGSPEAVAIEQERRDYLAKEFSEKPLLSRLFDVEDYRSAIVTLAHKSNWDISDSSIGTQLKNVARTFAALPNLIASSLNKLSYAYASPESDFYGFGTVGYTPEQRNNLPDYDVAADGVIKFHGEILTNNLNFAGIDKISEDGRVTYREDTDGDSIDTVADGGWSLGSNTSHEVILCDNGNFEWVEDLADDEATCEYTYTTDDDGVVIAGKTAYTTDQIVRSYLLDYPLIMSAATVDYRDICADIEDTTSKIKCEQEKKNAESALGEAMSDMGVSTGGSTNSTSIDFNAETIQAAFAATEGVYNDVNLQQGQCALIPRWFIGEYTTLNYASGAGSDLADTIAAANGNLVVSDRPVAPAIFGSCYMGASRTPGACSNTRCENGICGHTGLVIKVEGDTITTLETYSGMAGKSPYSYIETYNISDYPDARYLNLGAYLK